MTDNLPLGLYRWKGVSDLKALNAAGGIEGGIGSETSVEFRCELVGKEYAADNASILALSSSVRTIEPPQPES